MPTREAVARSRRRLDERLAALQPAEQYAVPRAGWIRGIREALGMSLRDLGARLGVSAQTVQGLERNEVAGGAQLDSLRRAAAAMDCTFVYAFVPNSSLHEAVRAQAERVLRRESRGALHTMALEAQVSTLTPAAEAALIDRLIDDGGLWRRG